MDKKNIVNNLEVLLSIAIPVYNGDKYLVETLDSIFNQLSSLDDKIEIVISDNASVDKTPQIVSFYQQKYSNLQYFRNTENVGADRNFDLAVKRSNGKFVWLFGDDDVIKAGGIAKVLCVLKEFDNLSNIFVNYSVYNGDLQICKEERALKIYQDILCRDMDDYFQVSTISSIVASSNIVRRDLWIQAVKEEFFETYWIHFAVLYSFFNNNQEFVPYCISEPYFVLRQGDVKWITGGNLFIFTLNLFELFEKMNNLGYSPETLKKLSAPIKNNLVTTIISSKTDGLPLNIPLIKKTHALLKPSVAFWILYLPLLLIPSSLYKPSPCQFVFFKFGGICKIILNLFE